MTLDEKWELMRSINDLETFEEVIELVEPKLEEMDEHCFGMLIERISILPEFVEQHRPFLTKAVEAVNNKLDGLRSAIRWGLLEALIKDETKVQTTDSGQ